MLDLHYQCMFSYDFRMFGILCPGRWTVWRSESGGITIFYFSPQSQWAVTAAKLADTPDDHHMPVGLPNMYTQIKLVNRQTGGLNFS